MQNKILSLAKNFVKIAEDFSEIRFAGDPVLRKVCQEVSVEEGAMVGKRLGEILLRYRKATGYGRGLAAPQIGEDKAVFVVFIDEKLQTIINPKIIERSEAANWYRELCLSAGVMSADVKRSEWVVMSWTDENGKKHQEKFEGFMARLYQHEEAHLRGVLNIDEAEPGGIELATFDPLKEQLRKTKKD
jgi:peptide deformylase